MGFSTLVAQISTNDPAMTDLDFFTLILTRGEKRDLHHIPAVQRLRIFLQ